MKSIKYLIFIALFFISCQEELQLSEPKIEVSDFILQDGFQIEVIASEPLIEAPVAMTFDNRGRIWVMEMPDYMPNIHGSDEDIPRGRIVILEDQNDNGRMDKAKVFLEKLHQPRAMALVYGGLLYAEAPNLWFVEIENDLPKNKILVDSLYAVGSNVEHQPNGLMMNLDNWIYNAKCNYRYRRVNGVWKKEPTHFRGQWGITKDDYGRLFYNDNSNPLYGDYVMPNQLTRNKFLSPKEGVGQNICKDRSLNPLQSTAVNRGYEKGILDKEGKLNNFTSACSPMIYRGGGFPDYKGNTFVCAPEINAIKRILLTEKESKIEGKPAWNDKEFLITKDEGFRPVNLNNAPDGGIYITDMHRGIIQHKVYMTAYLKKQIEDKKLDTIVNAGRIYRVFQKGEEPQKIDLDKMSNDELCNFLKNKNGWLRDRAQQLLVERQATDVVEKLKSMAINVENHLTQIHALWTLDGLNLLDVNVLLQIPKESSTKVSVSVIRLLEKFSEKNSKSILEKYEEYFQLENKELDLQLAFSISQNKNQNDAFSLLQKINQRYPDDALLAEAIVSGLEEKEKMFSDFIGNDVSGILKNKLQLAILNRENEKPNPIYYRTELWTDDKTVGRELFNVHCAACHGVGGEGLQNLAPSLLTGDLLDLEVACLATIILHGLEGEIHVDGEPQKFNAAMPGLKNNDELKDADIAAITNYVKNAFSENPQWLETEKVADLRKLNPKEGELFSEKELLEIFEKK